MTHEKMYNGICDMAYFEAAHRIRRTTSGGSDGELAATAGGVETRARQAAAAPCGCK